MKFFVSLFSLCLLASGALAAPAFAAPDIDLLLNRHLLHVHGQGLAIVFGGEGFRKYSQEYSSPWGAPNSKDGMMGRPLNGRAAILNIPVESQGPHTLRLRAHGLITGQKISVHINGKNIKNTDLPASFDALLLPLDAGVLKPGENELRFTLSKKVGSSYAVFASLEVLPGTVADAGAPLPVSPVAKLSAGGKAMDALTGFSQFHMLVEIPPRAQLQIQTGVAAGSAEFSVTAVEPGGKTTSLLQAKQETGWVPRALPLEALAGKLVRLQLAMQGDAKTAGWGEPRITVAAPSLARPAPYKNAILIVVDALRQDRVPVYGGKGRVTMPNLMKLFQAQGVAFMHNQAASPSSPPSHGSIQTGMIPRTHGVVGDKAQVNPGTPTVSGQLADAGFATGYYGNNPFGMARQEKPGKWTEFHHPNQEGKSIDCTALVTEMLGFAGAQSKAGKRFFISSLPYETHTPYRYHEGISDKFHKGPWDGPVGKLVNGDLLGKIVAGKITLTDAQWNQLRALYDGEAQYWDGCFGQLLDGLQKLGIANDTAILLTGDHGEGLYEHGYMGHAWGHYEEVSAVPLVVFGAGLTAKPGSKIDVVTGHVDIVPTVLDLVGVKPSEKVQGISLLPMVQTQGVWTPRVLSLEYGRSYALRARQWKYIVDYAGNEQVFDLQKDPGEKHDLVKNFSAAGALGVRYLRDLTGFLLIHRADWRMASWGDLNNHGPGFLKVAGP